MSPLRRSAIVCLVVLAAATLPALALSACGGRTAPPTADRVVAVVNGHPVRESDVAVVRAEKRFVGQADAAPAALSEAIDRELVRQEAARLGAVADAAVVGRRLNDLTAHLGGASALKTALGRAAMTDAQLRQSVTDGVLREAVQNREFPRVAVAASALRAYYARHRTSLFTQAAAVRLGAIPVRTELVAENALGRIRQGYPFSEVARQFSIDPQSRDAGGDLGLVLTSSLPGPLRKAAASAHPGVLARPVKAGDIWYVLDIHSRRPAQVIPFAKVRARLREQLTRVKRARALDAWLTGARTSASIERK